MGTPSRNVLSVTQHPALSRGAGAQLIEKRAIKDWFPYAFFIGEAAMDAHAEKDRAFEPINSLEKRNKIDFQEQTREKKQIKTEIMDDGRKRLKSKIRKLAGHIVDLQRRVSTLKTGPAPSTTSAVYDQAKTIPATSADPAHSVISAICDQAATIPAPSAAPAYSAISANHDRADVAAASSTISTTPVIGAAVPDVTAQEAAVDYVTTTNGAGWGDNKDRGRRGS